MSAHSLQIQPITAGTRTTPRPRRCSICGDTTHDRRFHSIAERAQQATVINAHRENRQRLTQLARERRQPNPVNPPEDLPFVSNIRNILIQRKMKYFKYKLQRIARKEKFIAGLIQKLDGLFEYRDSLIQYAIELGAPHNLQFIDYFWRIVSLVYVMFNDLNVISLNDMVIGDHFMNQPDEWYESYCKSFAILQREQYENNVVRLKQKRVDTLIIHREMPNDSCEMVDCPICYESNPKNNTIETICNHNFCRDCFTQFVMNTNLDKSLDCPMCRTDLSLVYCQV